MPGWLGEHLDVGWAIDVLHPLAAGLEQPSRLSKEEPDLEGGYAVGGADAVKRRSSVHHRSSVDIPRLPGDVVARRRREEQRQARDVVGTRDAAGGRKR